MSTPLDYHLLWTRESGANSASMSFVSQKVAQTWPGFPKNPTRPVAHALKMNLQEFPYPEPVLPVRSTRKRRNRGYSNLSNYNSVP